MSLAVSAYELSEMLSRSVSKQQKIRTYSDVIVSDEGQTQSRTNQDEYRDRLSKRWTSPYHLLPRRLSIPPFLCYFPRFFPCSSHPFRPTSPSDRPLPEPCSYRTSSCPSPAEMIGD